VAQWIEHQTSNLGVAGSSPAEGTTFIRKGGVAQMVERVLCMHEAQGSIPCSSNFCFYFPSFLLLFLLPPTAVEAKIWEQKWRTIQ
jgi:hypothetical protein